MHYRNNNVDFHFDDVRTFGPFMYVCRKTI